VTVQSNLVAESAPLPQEQLPSRPPTRRKALGPRVIFLIASAITLAILTLLGVVVILAFSEGGLGGKFTGENFAMLFQSTFALQALGNTAIYTVVATITAVLIGVPIAWIVERTDLPGKGIVYGLFVVGVLIPGFFVAMGWLFMFNPTSGVVNQIMVDVFDLKEGPFNIVTMPAMGFVQGLSLASVVFAMTSATFRTMDVALEEAARTAGGTFLQQLFRVTLPLAWPAILAATIYTVIIAFGAFDIPAIIGLSAREYTFSTFLYYNVNPQGGPPKYGLVAAFSTLMIMAGIALSWAYSRVLKGASKYRVVTGKNYKVSIVSVSRGWKSGLWIAIGGYFLLSMAMPLLAVVWTSLLPYIQPPSAKAFASISLDNLINLPWRLIGDATLNTVVLVLLVPSLALIWSIVLSWMTLRSKYKFRALYDYVAFIPHAVPSLILGVGALLLSLFILPRSWGLYGSLLLLVLVLSLVKMSFGSRMTNTGLMQIHPELEEAAAISGAGTFTTFRRVLLPLLKPTFQSAWLWIAILTFRELTVPLILFSPSNVTLSTAVWSLWAGGSEGQAAMLTVLMMIIVTPLAILYMRFSRAVDN
jgi:iron(III) transport system permease protein